MKTSSHKFFLALLCLVFVAADATAQRSTPTGQSTIRGRAIFDDTEKPVRRARVQLFSVDSQSNQVSVTDGAGEFSFKNVPAGQYRVIVSFPGNSFAFYYNEAERDLPMVTVDGAASADIRVRVPRGAAITGKITYPDGEPVIGAQVNVFVKSGKQWTHAPISSSGAYSDDRGIYRIYPLTAGEYIISVIEQSLVVENRDGGSMETISNQSLSPYFYQDASTLSAARILKVEAGRELSNINLTLTERSTYKVSGTVTLRGKPLADVYLRLDARDEVTSGPTLVRPWGMSARANRDGQWSFTGVPDGNYTVVLESRNDGRTVESVNGVVVKYPVFVNRKRELTVSGADVPDVVIDLLEGGRISGEIVVEGNKPLPHFFIRTEPQTGNKSNLAGTRIGPETNGKFLIEGVSPGQNLLVSDPVPGFFVKSLTWKDRDLLRQPIPVEEGKEVTGVRIVLSTDVGKLSGVILAEDKKPVARRRFVLLPTDEGTRDRVDRMLGGVTDNAGRFEVSGPPGEYFFVVESDRSRFMSIDDVKKLISDAQRVTVRVSDVTPVEIVMRPD